MTTTVTLQLDEKLMDSVQNYALQHGQSLSELIENYLKNLASQ
jgi:predicted HicB family RNase H-like nuclease